jgi:hypothetical protein
VALLSHLNTGDDSDHELAERPPHKEVAKIVHCGLPQEPFGACASCAKLLRPQDLEETEHFRRWGQAEVAKIVQCGEHLQGENTDEDFAPHSNRRD